MWRIKVRLVKRRTLEKFADLHAASRNPIKRWLSFIRYADWANPHDIIKTFRSADLLGKGTNRVVFYLGGNNFRLIAAYYFSSKQVHLYIKWIGTHGDYSYLCMNNEQYSVNLY